MGTWLYMNAVAARAPQKEHQHGVADTNDKGDGAGVDANEPLDEALDGVEEKAQQAGLLLSPARRRMSGQSRRECERVEGRDRDGEGNRQGELLVKNAGGSREEADGNEDGDEHERRGDDGAGDFGHGDAGGLVRIGGDGLHAAGCMRMLAELSAFGFRQLRISGNDRLPERWRCTFSMTTMASSTTSPVARVMPKSVSELMEKPKILMKAKVPMSETGMVTAGMMVARQSCRNRKMTMMTMMMASPIGRDDLADRVADDRGSVDGDDALHARAGMIFRVRRGRRGTSCRRRERWRLRAAGHRFRWRRRPENLRSVCVVFGADLGVADVFEQNDAVGGRAVLDDDVLELRRIGEAADDADGHLEVSACGSEGCCPSCPAATSTFCSASALVTSSAVRPRAARRFGIEPDAHGVFALAEDDDVTDAGNALERILDVDVEVVGDEGRRERVIGRDETGGENEVGVGLGDGDAGVVDGGRETALHGGDAILHVDCGDVEVVAGLEGNGDGGGAVVRAGGAHVAHALDAVDGLLEDGGDGGLNVFRVGADVVAGDDDLRRRELSGRARSAESGCRQRRRER